jgi:hypothetical protein
MIRSIVRRRSGVRKWYALCLWTFGPGTTVTVVAQATIDHVVPLADAWRTGADQWTAAQRKAFGNDLTDAQLIIASSSSNSSKDDKDPSEWKPPNTAYWCTYGEEYVSVKYAFHLFGHR